MRAKQLIQNFQPLFLFILVGTIVLVTQLMRTFAFTGHIGTGNIKNHSCNHFLAFCHSIFAPHMSFPLFCADSIHLFWTPYRKQNRIDFTMKQQRLQDCSAKNACSLMSFGANKRTSFQMF